jgi:hypothetical protein
MLAENLPVSNTIIVRTKTGTGWETAQTLATTSGLVKYTDTEADSTHSYIVFCVDTDSDLASDGDNELFYMDNTSSSWSTPLQLTSDPNTDVNPQLVKTTSGLMLVWARDGNIVSTTDITGMTGITEVVSQQGSSSQRNFVATISPTGNISVIWNNPSAAGSDIYTATYDPTMLVWSAVVQMTDNRDMERSITAAYSTGDALELAYNKVHIEDGNGLDVFGQVDLCTYEYSVGSDLTVNADSIRIDDSNAVPGDTVIVQATVVNIGDTAVNNIPIAFYCGETADPCNQIDQTQLISGDLAAGNETIVSVSWTIPDSNDPLNIIIVADPNLQIEDKNRQNNSASIQMFGANLALANVLVNKTERGDLYITADVINNGFIPVPEGLEFDLKTQETITLDKQLVAALDPGEHHTITLVSSSHDLAYGEIELNVIVDADNMIEESSKTDNIRSVSVINLPSFNMDNIGIVDMVDFTLFAEYWQRGDCEEPDWCGGADFELTGSVGFDELAKLAENWLKEL